TSQLTDALARRTGPTVVVSNEVGMGIVPEHPMGREYRDDLGRLNQQVAALAHTTLLLVAGRATRLDDPWTLLT
ncbi:MAG: bifunctional adenosylcobinamide kinase/adenosylcobinamide-phosphate guanylyltransferase, partial [Actinomycetota bacterium]